MKTVKELNKSKVPIVILDKDLDKLNDIVLFPKKLALAEEQLKGVKLSKLKSAAGRK